MNDLGIVHDATELRKLIAENPELPIVVLAGEQAWVDGFAYGYCTDVRCKIGWVLDCETPCGNDSVYTDESEFEDDLGDYLFTYTEMKSLSENDFDKRLKEELAKYEPYWKKVIAIYADN